MSQKSPKQNGGYSHIRPAFVIAASALLCAAGFMQGSPILPSIAAVILAACFLGEHARFTRVAQENASAKEQQSQQAQTKTDDDRENLHRPESRHGSNKQSEQDVPQSEAGIPAIEQDASQAAMAYAVHAGSNPEGTNDAGLQENPSQAAPIPAQDGFENEWIYEEESLEQAQAEALERIEIVDRMLSHSEDIFATSKDLASSRSDDSAFEAVIAMLNAYKPLLKENPPCIKPIKLGRTKRYWFTTLETNDSEELLDTLMGLESIYNINQDLQLFRARRQNEENAESTASDQSLNEELLAILAHTSQAEANYESDNDYLNVAYPDVSPEKVVGEWALRNAIASAAENATLPFRINFNMRTNAQRGLALIHLEVPRPACFAFVSADEKQQAALARDYAFRSALFMAQAALGACPASPVVRAVVVCHEHGSNDAIMSIDANLANINSLKDLAQQPAPIDVTAHPLFIRAKTGERWLEKISPHITAQNKLLNPDRYHLAVETSLKPCYPRLAQSANAQFERDLGCREEAFKEEAWRQLGSLGETTGSSVAALQDLRNYCEDASVKEACDRSMRALVEGRVAPSQIEQLRAIFMGNSDLASAVALGMSVYTSQSHTDIQMALDRLTEALTPQLQISMMDDTETVFRYFQNSAERLFYNISIQDKREVKLVPRVYYTANELAAHLLCLLNRSDEAMPFADEVMRIAPISSNAAVTKARVLEFQSKIFEAVDLMNEAAKRAATVHDAALCYYRMAYLQWRLGKNKLSYACYRIAQGLRTEISIQATKEMQELLESDDSLVELTASEACRVLDKEGLHVWDVDDHRNELARAAVLSTDQLIYPCAAQLTMNLLEYKQDDAVACIFRSLVDY